ncbi:unnamed protein product [Meloidogyne enterolobii]|uniref:Uncharacterized protein n=1 Tax=Meloidogyne enterolobii TaxID=390850 RepID=A0ACB0YHD9_MELEN
MELNLDSRSSIEVSSLCFKDALHLAVVAHIKNYFEHGWTCFKNME